MAYKLAEIKNLLDRFGIDAFDITSGEKEVQSEYIGFFGNCIREIYVKVLQNMVETKYFKYIDKTHDFGFSDGNFAEADPTLYRYFLLKDSIKELEDIILSCTDKKERIYDFYWKLGEFSYTDDFSESKFGTLVGFSKPNGACKYDIVLDGVTDNGEEIHGFFFKTRKTYVLNIEGVPMPNVPLININPIPTIPNEDVEKAKKNFDDEVKKHQESKNSKNQRFDNNNIWRTAPKSSQNEVYVKTQLLMDLHQYLIDQYEDDPTDAEAIRLLKELDQLLGFEEDYYNPDNLEENDE